MKTPSTANPSTQKLQALRYRALGAVLAIVGTTVALVAPATPALAVPTNYTLWDECVNDATAQDPVGPNGYKSWEDANFASASGFGQNRLLLEAQSWWFPHQRAFGGVGPEDDPEDRGGLLTGASHGHIHTAICVPDWRDQWTSQYMGLHMRVEVRLGGCVPVGCDTNVIDQVKANDIQFQGVDEAGDNELVDDFDNFPQSQLTCDRATDVECVWYFEFTKGQTYAPTCVGTGMSVRCEAPKIDLTDSSRGTCPVDCGFETDGIKQFRIYGIQAKGFDDGVHEANMRAIVRFPLDLNLGRTIDNADLDKQVVEMSGWWTNKENDAAGGYVTTTFTNAMGVYRKNPVTPGAVYRIDPFMVQAQPCLTDCSVQRRELAGWRAYFDPAFHDPINFDEKTGRIPGKDVLFSIMGDTDTTTNETNGAIQYQLSAVDRDFTIPSTWGPGLHKIVIIARQPTQKVDGTPSIPARDESTLFGVFVHYVVVAA